MSIPRYGQPLGARETEILRLVSQGLSYGEAAGRLQPPVTENTAKAHMQRVLTKLGASTAPHAVFLACQAGILDGRPRRHGDHAGYAAHVYRGEDPCEACWDGERAYRAGRRAARRAAKANPPKLLAS
ncbi:helix-turn-helix transcriptional regulator [Streptomyces sp. PKU-EA00015]|uniref:response regulator transcription factor n=1 Tax=Streptomyces sp. PKU-EA00015 TaxID=2748326 RepID=UPI002810ED5A|nr:helix-turn-helix transcriptional regulator [Streptomyces sp. PKU-EA00015]